MECVCFAFLHTGVVMLTDKIVSILQLHNSPGFLAPRGRREYDSLSCTPESAAQLVFSNKLHLHCVFISRRHSSEIFLITWRILAVLTSVNVAHNSHKGSWIKLSMNLQSRLVSGLDSCGKRALRSAGPLN